MFWRRWALTIWALLCLCVGAECVRRAVAPASTMVAVSVAVCSLRFFPDPPVDAPVAALPFCIGVLFWLVELRMLDATSPGRGGHSVVWLMSVTMLYLVIFRLADAIDRPRSISEDPVPASRRPRALKTDSGLQGASLVFRLATWLWLPLIVINDVILCRWLFSSPGNPGFSLNRFRAVSVAGAFLRGVAMTAAHEANHRGRARWRSIDGAVAFFIMAMCSYGSNNIHHVFGHHSKVGTPNDSSTARAGEGFGSFLLRSVSGDIKSARRIAASRPTLWGRSEVFRTYAVSTLCCALLWRAYGWGAALLFIVQGALSIVLFEATSYLQHYGLTRKKIAGAYEPVQHFHAWNQESRLVNFLLFNLCKHSNHHVDPTTPYQQQLPGPQPRLPRCYPALTPLVLFNSSRFMRIMQPLLDQWHNERRKERSDYKRKGKNICCG